MTSDPPLYSLTRAITRILGTVMFDLRVYGVDHVPKTGGVLLIANHESYLDPVLVAVRIRRQVSFLAKAQLFENPLFAWVIRNLGAFPIKLGAGDKAAIEETIRQLQAGRVLNLYPEGARTFDGTLGPIQRGVALVVKRADVPVVPVVVTGSYEAWPRTRRMFRAHPIRVMYGPPLAVAGLKGEAVVKLIDRTFREMLTELRVKNARRA